MANDIVPHERNGEIAASKDDQLRKILKHEANQSGDVTYHIKTA